MRMSRHLIAALTLSTTLGAMAPAHAAFEFLKKSPAKAVTNTTAGSSSATTTATPAAPAAVPVTRLDAVDDMSNAELAKDVPVWSAKPVAETTTSIPLTPVVTASDSLEIIDGPLMPGATDGASVTGLPNTEPQRTMTFEQDRNGIPHSILWENGKPIAQTASAPNVTRQTTTMMETTTPAATPVMPVSPVVQKTIATPPAPIVETIIETKQAAPTPPADDAVVQGFGSGIPMVMALRQIVPPTYRFSFDPGVDPGQRISWTGNKPWSQVVEDMAASQGLKSEIAGNVIAFRKVPGGAPRTMMASTSSFGTTPAQPVAAAPKSMMEDIVLGDDVLPSGKNVTPETATLADVESTTASPMPLQPSKTPVVEKKIEIAESTTVTTSPAMPAAKVSDAEPITDETTIEATPVLTEPMPLMPSVATLAPAPKTEKPPVVIDNKIMDTQEWVARSGSSLRTVLQEWSKQAHVSLVWSSDFDYPLQTDLRIQGNYPDAVRTLLAGFSKAQPKPIGRLHKNAGVGAQPVLIVDTPRLING